MNCEIEINYPAYGYLVVHKFGGVMKMKHLTSIFALVLACIVIIIGCDLSLYQNGTGGLTISLGSSSRNLVWEPALDMDIASYTVSGAGPTAEDSFEVSGHTEGLFTKDALAVGDWTITVDGYNTDGDKIATAEANVTIVRDETTAVTMVLRPLEGTGTLSVSMSWTDSHGVLVDPGATVVIRDEEGAAIDSISTPVDLTVDGQSAAGTITDLSTGWYEVTVNLSDGSTTAWQGVFTLRIVKDQTTTGTVTIPEEQLQIGPGMGTVSITIEEDMDSPLAVGFSGMPETIEAGTEVTLISTETYSGSEQYRWYVNGVRQTDETTSSFTYTLDEVGTHTVSLLVLDGGTLGGYGESVVVEDAGQVPEYSIPMVYVEGGAFEMGSNYYSWEQPIHTVSVNSFYMGTYEVTQDIYEEVMGSNPSNWKGARLPVEKVNWYEAVAFANALSERDGLEAVYTIEGTVVSADWSKVGYRLPTEAEWEFAARGGNQSQAYTYAGSNTAGDVAWYYDNSWGMTHEVGTKQANELGLYDMSGNVMEWCWDWSDDDYYSSSPAENPKGPSSGSYRVLRGGRWGHGAQYVRSANRIWDWPSSRYSGCGFRLVLPAE